MSYIVKMKHEDFCRLPPYDKQTVEAGQTYRLFKIGLYNLKTMTGYIKKISYKYGADEKGTVHKVEITDANE